MDPSTNLRGVGLVLLFLAGAGLACQGVPLKGQCPDEGGAPWREFSSPHFVVKSNLKPALAREAVIELEKMRAALLALIQTSNVPMQPLEAVIFADRGQAKPFISDIYGGIILYDDVAPVIVTAGLREYLLGETELNSELHTHEFAHYVASYKFVRQPRWFAEGWATYLASLRLEGDHALLGRVSKRRVHFLRYHSLATLEALWRWDALDDHADRRRTGWYYASSWLWVLYLVNHEPARFEQFTSGLARGTDPRRAFEAAFAGVDLDLLHRRAVAFLGGGTYQVQRLLLSLGDIPIAERVIPDVEVHTLLARLSLGAVNTPDRVRFEWAQDHLRSALAKDGSYPQAVILKAKINPVPADRLAAARELVQAQPASREAWFFLATLLMSSDFAKERSAALARALALWPDHPPLLAMSAVDRLLRQEPGVGLDYARRAVELAPWQSRFHSIRSLAALAAKDCAQAIASAQRAVDTLSDEASDGARAEAGKVLARTRQECRGAGAHAQGDGQ